MKHPKPVNLNIYLEMLIFLVILILLIWNFALFHSLQHVLPDLDPENVSDCTVICSTTTVTPPLSAVHTDQLYRFDPASPEFEQMVSMLKDCKYRRHLSNLLPDDHSRSITLDTRAEITLIQDGVCYVFGLYGKAMEIGTAQGSQDYSPRGGLAFQEELISFIQTHGTLISSESW